MLACGFFIVTDFVPVIEPNTPMPIRIACAVEVAVEVQVIKSLATSTCPDVLAIPLTVNVSVPALVVITSESVGLPETAVTVKDIVNGTPISVATRGEAGIKTALPDTAESVIVPLPL